MCQNVTVFKICNCFYLTTSLCNKLEIAVSLDFLCLLRAFQLPSRDPMWHQRRFWMILNKQTLRMRNWKFVGAQDINKTKEERKCRKPEIFQLIVTGARLYVYQIVYCLFSGIAVKLTSCTLICLISLLLLVGRPVCGCVRNVSYIALSMRGALHDARTLWHLT